MTVLLSLLCFVVILIYRDEHSKLITFVDFQAFLWRFEFLDLLSVQEFISVALNNWINMDVESLKRFKRQIGIVLIWPSYKYNLSDLSLKLNLYKNCSAWLMLIALKLNIQMFMYSCCEQFTAFLEIEYRRKLHQKNAFGYKTQSIQNKNKNQQKW